MLSSAAAAHQPLELACKTRLSVSRLDLRRSDRITNGMRVLVTGGGGFIGTQVVKALVARRASVTVLDNLSQQIHGPEAQFAAELLDSAACVRGDVRDRDLVARLLYEQEVLIHLASETGTGQSMYAVAHYADVNVMGTALILDTIVNARPPSLRKLVVASSRAVYGEGKYRCPDDGVVYPGARGGDDLRAGRFEPICPQCGGPVALLPTSEDAPFAPTSFYGLTKQVQEQMVLMFAGVLGLSAFALRYQNVYGPGQSLANPYTGILAIFSNLARLGERINIFEDGLESRDFVFIEDVVEATVGCLSDDISGVRAFNVGSGVATSVLDVARSVAAFYGAHVPIAVTGDFRLGDIRHNVADLSAIRAATGFEPRWSFADGVEQFLRWSEDKDGRNMDFARSMKELRDRGLLRTSAR